MAHHDLALLSGTKHRGTQDSSDLHTPSKHLKAHVAGSATATTNPWKITNQSDNSPTVERPELQQLQARHASQHVILDRYYTSNMPCAGQNPLQEACCTELLECQHDRLPTEKYPRIIKRMETDLHEGTARFNHVCKCLSSRMLRALCTLQLTKDTWLCQALRFTQTTYLC